MPINLAEVLQVSFDLVRRAEQAEARIVQLESELAQAQKYIYTMRKEHSDVVTEE